MPLALAFTAPFLLIVAISALGVSKATARCFFGLARLNDEPLTVFTFA